MKTFKPTYLYIKCHSITGKLYFGKTECDNVLQYLGSGKTWTRHIHKHGKEHVITLWYCLFYDKESIQEFALNFSAQENIVESKLWANLRFETGIDGGDTFTNLSDKDKIRFKHLSGNAQRGIPRTQEIKRKISYAHKGKPKSEMHKLNMSISAKIKIFTDTHRENISIATSGQLNPHFGVSQSEFNKLQTKLANTGKVSAFDLSTFEFVKIDKNIFDEFKGIKYVGVTSRLAKKPL